MLPQTSGIIPAARILGFISIPKVAIAKFDPEAPTIVFLCKSASNKDQRHHAETSYYNVVLIDPWVRKHYHVANHDKCHEEIVAKRALN